MTADKGRISDKEYAAPNLESDSEDSSSSENIPLKYLVQKKYNKIENEVNRMDNTPNLTEIPSGEQNICTFQVLHNREDEGSTNTIDPIKINPSATISNLEMIPDGDETFEDHNNIDLVVEELQVMENEENLVQRKRKRKNASEKIQRDREKHPQLGGCLLKCKNKKCSEITDEDRKEIWNEFWSLQYSVRRQWLCRHVRICQVQRRTVQPKNLTVQEYLDDDTTEEEKTGRTFLKNESREYFLPRPCLQYKQVKVCKKLFLSTLGYTNDSVITELSHAIKKSNVGEAIGENRGRSAPVSKVDRNIIINHIESFGPSLSHYRRHNAPNCRYLSRDLTVQIMYEDFLGKHPDFCKVETYRNTLKTMNISLKMPKGDRCAECLTYEAAIKEANNENRLVDPDLLAKKELHERKASQAKALYKIDKTRTQELHERIYSMDLQKVILLPIMPYIKDSFFISRLVVYNETYAILNSNYAYKSVAVLWHEALQGRNADSIVDTIYTVMNMDNEATLYTFWADNCTSQNKNWTIYSSLVHMVNQQTGSQQVIIRYLTKGHTHMSADSVHGNIEKAMRAAGSIDNFDEFVRVVQRSRKQLHVEKQEIFREWKSKKRVNSNRQKGIKGVNTDQPGPPAAPNVLLQHIVEVKFVKGKRELLYKTDFESDQYEEIDFLQKKFVPNQQLPPIKGAYRGINAEKKAAIVKDLVPKMKNINHRAFWLNLPESEQSRDLLNNYVE